MHNLRHLFDHPEFPEWTPKIELPLLLWAVGRMTPTAWDRIHSRMHFLQPLALALGDTLRRTPDIFQKHVFAYPPTLSARRTPYTIYPGLFISPPSGGEEKSPKPRTENSRPNLDSRAPLRGATRNLPEIPKNNLSLWAVDTGLEGILENPPSNWHIAQYIFNSELPYGPPSKKASPKEKWARTLYAWFLLGIPAHVLEPYASLHGARDFWDLRAHALKQLMEIPAFHIWAMGMDMRPAIIRPEHAQCLVGAPMRTNARKKALIELQSHPYVKSLMQRRISGNPIPHIVPPKWKHIVMRDIEEYLRVRWEVPKKGRRKARDMYVFNYMKDNGFDPEDRPGVIKEYKLWGWGSRYDLPKE